MATEKSKCNTVSIIHNGNYPKQITKFFMLTPRMKMKLTECSETTAHKIQTPGNHPKERIQNYNKFKTT